MGAPLLTLLATLAVSAPRTVTLAEGESLTVQDLAAVDDHWLIAYQRSVWLHLARLDADGTISGDHRLGDFWYQARLAPAEHGVGVAFLRESGVYFRLADADGAEVMLAPRPLGVEVAWNPAAREFAVLMVTYSDGDHPYNRVRLVRLSPRGKVLSETLIAKYQQAAPGKLEVVPAGRGYRLVLSAFFGGVDAAAHHGTRVFDVEGGQVREHPALRADRVIALAGDALLWESLRDSRWELHLSRLDGAAVAEDRVLRLTPDSLLFSGTMAADAQGGLVVMWSGDGFHWAPVSHALPAPSHAEGFSNLSMRAARGPRGLAVLWGRTLFVDPVGDRVVELKVSLFP